MGERDLEFDRVYRLLRDHHGDMSATAKALGRRTAELNAAVTKLGLSQLAKKLRDYHENGAHKPDAVYTVGEVEAPRDEMPPRLRRMYETPATTPHPRGTVLRGRGHKKTADETPPASRPGGKPKKPGKASRRRGATHVTIV